ncbi:MAG TPA: hypothetical protein VL945_02805 [Candidatus Saccharimonadales bacterium]|nr:hypothetical protein [Candidatus Saccharimonadales bacterium]
MAHTFSLYSRAIDEQTAAYAALRRGNIRLAVDLFKEVAKLTGVIVKLEEANHEELTSIELTKNISILSSRKAEILSIAENPNRATDEDLRIWNQLFPTQPFEEISTKTQNLKNAELRRMARAIYPKDLFKQICFVRGIHPDSLKIVPLRR